MHASNRVNPWLLVILLGGMPLASCGGSEDRQFAPQTGTGASSGTGARGGSGGRGGTSGAGGTDGSGGSVGTDGSSGTAGTSGTAGSAGTDGSSGTAGASGTAGSSGTTGTGGSAACTTPANCDDGNTCNGAETCSSSGTCVAGTDVADKTPCTRAGATGNHYCNAGNCAPSRCGDGVVDAAAQEQCDDANAINGDGCEEDCKFTCATNPNCDNANPCDGAETCDQAQHKCAAGANLADGTGCGTGRVCRQGSCVTAGCGNGVREGAEECDDGNTREADGCDNDCTFSCKADTDCDNANRCDGAEKCTLATHVCAAGTALACDDQNACTRNECNPTTGCVYTLTDADRDGHAPRTLGACGDDCNDADNTIFTGAEELCDNKDNNCNGSTDETAPKWYVDCDGDTYAPAGASPVQQCAKPPPSTTCASGSAREWTNRTPADLGSTDCWDTAATVNPTITAWSVDAISGRPVSVDYDYNCDNVETKYWTATGVTSGAGCGSIGTIGSGGIIGTAEAPPSEFGGAGGTSGDDVAAAGIGGVGGIAVFCVGTDGWVGSTPAECGQYASFSECTSSGSSCVRNHGISKRQQCH
jgi:cysteine-rich repeat protein